MTFSPSFRRKTTFYGLMSSARLQGKMFFKPNQASPCREHLLDLIAGFFFFRVVEVGTCNNLWRKTTPNNVQSIGIDVYILFGKVYFEVGLLNHIDGVLLSCVA